MALCSPARGQLRAACPHAHRTPPPARVTSTSAARRSYGMHRLCTTTRSTVVCPASVQHAPSSEGPTDPPDSSQPAVAAHATFLAALKDNKLAELVIGEQMGLGTATNMCFEVLGIASKPPDQQRSAARSLVSLCTHPDLRPAVDPLLVLRRLGRVVECTRAPAALGAALEALVAVADDAGWEDKGGASAEAVALANGMSRCITAVVAATSDETPSPSTRAMADAALAAMNIRCLRDIMPQSALVEAAAAVSSYMVWAARQGLGGLWAPLVALDNLLDQCTWAGRVSTKTPRLCVPYDVGMAVVRSGAVEPLLRVIEAGSATEREAAADAGEEDIGYLALLCLHAALVACSQGSGSDSGQLAVREALAAVGMQRVIAAVLPYMHDVCYARALEVLLAAQVSSGDSLVAAVEAVVAQAASQEGVDARRGVAAIVLHAADVLLDADDAPPMPLFAAALFELLARLCASGVVQPDELLEWCPSARDAAVGVTLRQAAASGWDSLEALAVEDITEGHRYPAVVELAALKLLQQLSASSSWGKGDGMDSKLVCRLAAAQVHELLPITGLRPANAKKWEAHLQFLATCLQAVPEECGLWVVDSSGSSTRRSGGTTALLNAAAAAVRESVTISNLVQLVGQLSTILAEHPPSTLRALLAAPYSSILQAAAVLTKAAWTALTDQESYNRGYRSSCYGSDGPTLADGQQAVCRLLVRILSIGPNSVSLACTADVLNTAVACLQPDLLVQGEKLTPLPSVQACTEQQHTASYKGRVDVVIAASSRQQLDVRQRLGAIGHYNVYSYNARHSAKKAEAVTAQDLITGIQAAHRRLLELVTAEAKADASGQRLAFSSPALVQSALRVATNAGQLLATGLQAHY